MLAARLLTAIALLALVLAPATPAGAPDSHPRPAEVAGESGPDTPDGDGTQDDDGDGDGHNWQGDPDGTQDDDGDGDGHNWQGGDTGVRLAGTGHNWQRGGLGGT